ncbi:MAG TPA: rRNA maturation RNase YbeY [Solirubrobacteraceae bacterium]|jgi:probable rRNA maturation factor|nr:rRNA maturation RNase YbeY [Solirubrobacteraceae bacterium]
MLEVEVLGVGAPAGRSAAATEPRTVIDLPLEEVRRLSARAAASAGVSDGHVAIEFVDERRISELNARYRGRAEPTDVLSFPVDGTAPVQARRELGDVIICAEHTADVREAIVHGMLHLLEMDHETDGGEMLERQRELLARERP